MFYRRKNKAWLFWFLYEETVLYQLVFKFKKEKKYKTFRGCVDFEQALCFQLSTLAKGNGTL